MDLGKRLKSARIKSGLSQIQAAKQLDISNGTLSGYERNYRKPEPDMIKKMATLYNVSSGYLLDIDDDINRRNNEINKENIKQLPPDQREAVEWMMNLENLFFQDQPENMDDLVEIAQIAFDIYKRRQAQRKSK